MAVDLRGGSDDNWVRTVETFGAEQRPGWLLVDGTPHGLGMRPCRNKLARPSASWLSSAPCAPGCFELRPAPANCQMGRRNAGWSDIRHVFDIGELLRLAPLWPLPPVATGTELLHAFELQSPAEYKVLHPLVKVSPPNLDLHNPLPGPTDPEPAQNLPSPNPTTPTPQPPTPQPPTHPLLVKRCGASLRRRQRPWASDCARARPSAPTRSAARGSASQPRLRRTSLRPRWLRPSSRRHTREGGSSLTGPSWGSGCCCRRSRHQHGAFPPLGLPSCCRRARCCSCACPASLRTTPWLGTRPGPTLHLRHRLHSSLRTTPGLKKRPRPLGLLACRRRQHRRHSSGRPPRSRPRPIYRFRSSRMVGG